MPTFDFNCQQCHQHFEATVPFGTKKFPACPVCGGVKIEKLLSMPGIAFKGSGFYKNDAAPHPDPARPCPSGRRAAGGPLPQGERETKQATKETLKKEKPKEEKKGE